MWPISDKLRLLFVRIVFSTILIFCAGMIWSAPADTVVVKDCLSEAYFYSKNTGKYVPLVDDKTFDGRTIHFKIEKANNANLWLHIKSDQPCAVFIDQKLLEEIKAGEPSFFKYDSLADLSNNALQFTLYGKKLSVKNLEVNLLTVHDSESALKIEEDVVVISQRQQQGTFNNFLIMGAVLLGIFIAILYNYHPRVTNDFFRFGRALSVREIDENILKSRPFSWVNILFYFFFSLVTGYLLISIFYLSPFNIETKINGFASMSWLWLKGAGIIFAWLLAKYFLIRNFTSLFNIKNFLPSHYFNYVRLGFLIFLLAAGVLLISYLALEITSVNYYKTLFTLLLIAVSLRSVFLMIKLMNSASYKFLHLFSYLCGTEFIPLGILLFLGFNQPF